MDLSEKEIDDAKEMFRTTLEKNKLIFLKELRKKYTRGTVNEYHAVIHWWISYIYNWTEIYEFEKLKVSDCRSRFFNTETRYYIEEQQGTIYFRLKAFLVFLKEQGFENEKVFKSYKI